MTTPKVIAEEICRRGIVAHFDSDDQRSLESAIAKAIQTERDERIQAEKARDNIISKVASLLQAVDKDGEHRRALYAVMPTRLRGE